MVCCPQVCRPWASWNLKVDNADSNTRPPIHQMNVHKLITPSLNHYHKTSHYPLQAGTHSFEAEGHWVPPLPNIIIKLSFSTSHKFCLQDLIWLQCTEKLSFRHQDSIKHMGILLWYPQRTLWPLKRDFWTQLCARCCARDKEWSFHTQWAQVWLADSTVKQHLSCSETHMGNDRQSETFLIGNDTRTYTQGHFSRPRLSNELSTVSHILTYIEGSYGEDEGSSLPENKMPYKVK